MNQSKGPAFIYNETQITPILHNVSSGNYDIINKLTLLNNVFTEDSNKKCDEIQCIKNNQKNIESQLQKLFELCEHVGKSVSEVKEKLFQYDIDEVDEVSHNGESDNEMGNDSNTTKTEHHPYDVINDSINDVDTQNTENGHMDIADINYSSGLVVADYKSDGNDDESINHTELEPIKPKRKYNRKKK